MEHNTMRVLVFLGSPRKGGNSEVLTEALLKGVRQAGGEPEIIRLCDLNISPCLNCGGCDKTGKCVVDDDMTPLYDKILSTNLIILASPIFFYGITAQAKAFIDRCQALWNRKRLLKEKGEWHEYPERRGYFLSVAATSGTKIFEGAVLTMKYGYDAIGTNYDGELLVTGPDRRGDMAKFEKKLKEAEEAGRDFIINQLPAHVD
jgi:multimeric flavodoxin WrbA